ncbi:MAG TPA: BatD family protein [Pedobacter sp.]|nr:BatD family protein [Pedobacter sp.]
MKYFLLTIVLFWSVAGFAQGIRVTASVSSDQIGVGEQFELTFSTNGSPESFNPPVFTGFQIVGGPNQSSSFSSVNGATTINMSVTYIMVGVKEGAYAIGPATMLIGGKQYKSNAVRIKVIKGAATSRQQQGQSSASAQDANVGSGKSSDISKRLFLRAIANKTNVYQGEQISVSYKLYANINLVDNMLDKLPDFNGFWSQEIKHDNQNVEWKIEEYNGARYHVATLKEIVVFPERYGKLTLDPLAMTFVVRQPVPSNDPIEQFFGGGSFKDLKYKIKSAPVAINVKPLPEAGKPEGFQGAVGNFSIGATLDKSAIKANEALNYTVKIAGSGNLKLLKAPELKLAADIEKYDPKVSDRINVALGGVSGSREYTYLLIPRHEGSYTINDLKFSYFNPTTQRYVTLSTGSFPVKVAKGAPGTNVTAYSAGQQDVKALGNDIRYIKTSDGSLRKAGEEFYGSALYYSLLCLAPVAFLSALGYRKWYRARNKDLVVVKGRNANKIAAKHLSSAERQLQAGDKNAFYEDVYRGLYGYLSNKLNIAYADLNRENIGGQLLLRGIADPVVKRLTDTLDLCEMARYAPVSGISEQEVFERAKNIINDIENHA